MAALSVNIHCFQKGLRQPFNHIIAQTKPSTKRLSGAWVLSDTCHFHLARAFCQPHANTAFHQQHLKNVCLLKQGALT